MFTDNQKALAVFAFLLLALGCAGHGDYQDAKRHEVIKCVGNRLGICPR